MSIINDALKKARREGGGANDEPAGEEAPIRPRRKTGSKPGFWMFFSAVLLVVLFVGLVGGLGYFVYTEYMVEAEAPPPAATARAEEENGESGEPAADGEAPPPTPAAPPTRPGGTGIARSAPAEPTEDATARADRPAPASRAQPPAEPEESSPPGPPNNSPPAELLSRFSINGVMRGGSGARLLTNSGVYRPGDALAAPRGYRVESIGEDTVVIAGPGGERYALPLP